MPESNPLPHSLITGRISSAWFLAFFPPYPVLLDAKQLHLLMVFVTDDEKAIIMIREGSHVLFKKDQCCVLTVWIEFYSL